MSSVVRCRANSQKQTTILCRMLLDVEQTLNNRPLSSGVMSSVVLDVESKLSTLNNRPLSYVECC